MVVQHGGNERNEDSDLTPPFHCSSWPPGALSRQMSEGKGEPRGYRTRGESSFKTEQGRVMKGRKGGEGRYSLHRDREGSIN